MNHLPALFSPFWTLLLVNPTKSKAFVLHLSPNLAYLGLVSFLSCYPQLLDGNVDDFCSLIIFKAFNKISSY